MTPVQCPGKSLEACDQSQILLVSGGEAKDISNHNVHCRHFFQMSSPSSESPLRMPPCIQHNVVPHPARASMVVTGSPSRFAPGLQQSIRVIKEIFQLYPLSGANYSASSPSLAPSGGTSAVKVAHQQSPWN
ncbi:hypothetical protein SLA2020_201370 [Shorea laevis]